MAVAAPRRWHDDRLVELTCIECGTLRQVSARHARRARGRYCCNLCRCRAGSERVVPADRDRRWWLERLSDEEIGYAVEAMFPWLGEPDLEHIASERGRLGVPEPGSRRR